MVRINIGAKYLDIPASVSVQLTKKNILFAFDDASAERSTSFDVPATENNNTIFGFAGYVNNTGVGMRKQYDAVLEVDGVQTQGKLHITAYDKDKRCYSCVFVGGLLYGLIKLKALGKLKEFYFPNSAIYWRKVNEKRADAVTLNIFDIVKYLNEWEENNPDAVALPSIDLHALITAVAAQEQLTIQLPATEKIRYVPKEPAKLEAFPLKVKSTKGASGVNLNTAINNISSLLTNTRIPYNVNNYIAQHPDPQYPLAWYYNNTVQTYNLAGWMPSDDEIAITFPDNFPSTVLCVTELLPATSGALEYIADALGDRNARIQYTGEGMPYVQFTGTPLAGRTIEIQQGTRFAFIDISDIFVERPFNYSEGTIMQACYFIHSSQPYAVNGQPTYEYTLQLAQIYDRVADEAREDGIAMWACMPDLTFYDLCKAYAAMTGRLLYYTNAEGLKFLPATYNGVAGRTLDLTGRIVKAGKVTRTFADYAQNNIVRYADDESMISSEIIRRNYPIYNYNIDSEKELTVIPFSCAGSKHTTGGRYVAYVRDNENMVNAKEMAMQATLAEQYMYRKHIPEMALITDLCNNSTSVEVECMMPAFEFEALTGREVVRYADALWLWTSANWQKGRCKMNLQKI